MSDKQIHGYKIVALSEMLNELGKERVIAILSSFSSPNKDVDSFLKEKAVEFDIQSISKTHFVVASCKDRPVIAGYFTLSYKEFTIPTKTIPRKLRDRLKKFATFDSLGKSYKISAPLIAQLSKNFEYTRCNLITGDELLKIACDKVAEAHRLLGGKIVYVECEDKAKLREFYESNGFVIFSRRQLDGKSKENMNVDYLLQLLRYL